MVCVPQHRLGELIQGPVSLLKVDMEGAETWVFQGSEDLLQSLGIKQICFENNRARARRLGIEEDDATEVLKKHGYKIFEKGDALWAVPGN